MPLKILFACGGTGGHINPALAVAAAVRRDHRDAEILFAGNPNGMEADLIPRAGYEFAPINVYGFQRRLSWTNVKRNLKAAGCLALASSRARRIVRDFSPDVVVGTGGYVSGPVLRTAAKLGFPTVTHEQNAFPGVTTKLLCKYVDKVLLTTRRARDFLPPGREYEVTGLPVRQEILFEDREAARRELGIGDRICILSTGGSLGAERMNQAVAEVVARYSGKGTIHHIHATGQYGTELFPALLKERGVDHHTDPHMDIREYIYDLPKCLVAADLVIGRAGANTLAELQVAGKASILIPSPNVAENHQYHNAMVLADRGAAIVIEEKNLTGDALCAAVEGLITNRAELDRLGKNAASMAIVDADKRICKEIYSLTGVK